MENFGKIFVVVGVGIALIGGLIYLAGRAGIPLGRLPGDFRFSTGTVTCLIPLATSIILSIVLTILLNIAVRFLNK